MRKDVKLGFAIGGVLLAVLVVYVLVISGSEKPAEVSLVTSDAQASTAGAPRDKKSSETTAIDKPANAEKATSISDPFNPPVSASIAQTSEQTNAGADDKWSAALTTGRLPVMMTQTPSAKPVENPAAQKSAPQPDETSTMASNTPLAAPHIDVNEPSSPSTQPAALSADATTHVVQKGETFASIAQATYGSAAYYSHIIRANPTIDPRRLRAGTTIQLPPVSQVKADRESTSSTDASTAQPTNSQLDHDTYRVQAGDTLSKISLKLYGRRDRVDQLYDLNQATIGANRASLRVGMVLKLPEAPAVSHR